MNSELGANLVLAILSLSLLWIAVRSGLFRASLLLWNVQLRLLHVIGAFAIYFLVTYLSSLIALTFFRKEILLHYMAFSSWLNFLGSSFIFFFLLLYLKALPPPVRRGIFQRDPADASLFKDLKAALFTWILAFPSVLFLSEVIEFIIEKIFHLGHIPEQMAVKFLKSSFDHPLYFFLAIISIIILAPLVEETLFRGFLQTYIRKHLGPNQAVYITAACFSLFHYAAGQGLGNISIIFSLFIFALFLGFLYERRGSLFASMILHGTFNAVSVINLYLFES